MSLERELGALASSLRWPETPDVAAAVRAEVEHVPRRRFVPRRRRAIAIAVVVAAVAATLAVPQARTAILRAFGIGGVQVVRVDELPPAVPRSDLSLLGPLLSRADVAQIFPSPLLEFDADVLRAPDELRALDLPSSASYVWRDDDGDVQLLISQLSGHLSGAGFVKLAGPDAELEQLELDGHPALWITGDAHGFALDGDTFEELRLSANALLVDDGGLTIRIEGDLTREQAIRVYRALS